MVCPAVGERVIARHDTALVVAECLLRGEEGEAVGGDEGAEEKGEGGNCELHFELVFVEVEEEETRLDG
jgi:hypothetical protein